MLNCTSLDHAEFRTFQSRTIVLVEKFLENLKNCPRIFLNIVGTFLCSDIVLVEKSVDIDLGGLNLSKTSNCLQDPEDTRTVV